MDYAKTIDILSNPEGLESAFIKFLAANGMMVDKSKSFGGIVRYHGKRIVGATNTSFFDGAVATGENTNMTNFTSNQGEYFVITDARVYSGANATVNSTSWTPGVSSGEIQNGVFTAVNNGIQTLVKIPFTQFTQAVENPFSGVYEYPFFDIWGAQQTYKINVEFPATIAAANQNLRIELIGLGLVA